MALSDLLTQVVYNPGEQPLVAVDPATRFVYVSTEAGPERVDSNYRRVLVPTHDWQAKRIDETEEIVKVLVEAAFVNPLKVPSPKALNENFWVKHRGWRAILCSTALLGKFLIPEEPLVVTSEHVPPNRIVLVGTGAGFFVKHGARRGVLSNRAQGLMQIQFFAV